MRLSRPPMTVRRLMVLVAVVAGLITLGRMVDRRARFGRKATQMIVEARYQTSLAEQFRILARNTPGRATQHEDSARACDQVAAYSRRMADFWRDAANHPWRVGPTPEPAPE